MLESDVKDGKIYDARLEMPGWNNPGYSTMWTGVRVANHSKGNLVASVGPPVRRNETFKRAPIKTPKGERVLDFGQNLANAARFEVREPQGTTVRLRHGEALDAEGNFTVAHLHLGKAPDPEAHAFQDVHYTLKGEGNVQNWGWMTKATIVAARAVVYDRGPRVCSVRARKRHRRDSGRWSN